MNLFAFVVIAVCVTSSVEDSTVCDFFVSPDLPEKFDLKAWRIESGNASAATNSVVCGSPEYNTCMVLWLCDSYSDINCTSRTPLIKGCWNGAGQPDCQRDLCIDNGNPNRSEKIVPNSRFCCCSTDHCNDEYLFLYQPESTTESTTTCNPERFAATRKIVTIVAVCGLMCSMVAIVSCVAYSMWKSKWENKKRSKDEKAALLRETGRQSDSLAVPQPASSPGSFDLDQIALLECVGHGRYGAVWRAVDTSDSQKRLIAVKVYQLNSSTSKLFLNECEIYSIPHMNECRYLLSFYGGREKNIEADLYSPQGEDPRNMSGQMGVPRREGWLFLSYNSGGTLHEFLKANTVSWIQFCYLGNAITSALAFLHSEIEDGLRKPIILHRDISSSNVLMSADKMSCVLCDMGFALSADLVKTVAQDTSALSIAEVGTLRYLPPEVLEGTLNLREAELQLKSVDVYAMALVLWEIVSRCEDIHMLAGVYQVPDYELPYHRYIDARQNPLEQMRLCVCRKKIRPMLPTAVFSKPQLKCVLETFDDLWDHENEARLASDTARDRFHDLVANRSGLITAILNADRSEPAGGIVDLQYINQCHNNGRPSVVSAWRSGDSTGTSGIGSMVGDGSFKDTSANSHSYITSQQRPQPFEGRNLCAERNLISESSDESGIGSRITESSFVKVDLDALVSSVPTPRAQRPYSMAVAPPTLIDQQVNNVFTTPGEDDNISTLLDQGKPSRHNRVLSWLSRGITGDKKVQRGVEMPEQGFPGYADGNSERRVKNVNQPNLDGTPLVLNSGANERNSENVGGGASSWASSLHRKRSRSLQNFHICQLADVEMNETDDEETQVADSASTRPDQC